VQKSALQTAPGKKSAPSGKRSRELYKRILEAVQPLQDVQVVLSVGHNVDPENLAPFLQIRLSSVLLLKIELLKRAALCITHAGLNTALESLAHGVSGRSISRR
jgi:UDP:flavonoid glycosyltransferase YjiC (YdhE family)